MSDPTPACYRDRNNGVRYQRGIHHAACADSACRGCRPCPERAHCTARKSCGWHVPAGTLTCGRCLAKTRRKLHQIGDLATLIPVASYDTRLDSETVMLAGPSVDPEAWSWRKIAALTAGTPPDKIEDDDNHPIRVIGEWTWMISETYGHTPARHLTAGIAYLDLMLHRIAQDPGQDFGQLSRDLSRCVRHLEIAIRNGDQIDRGAPCPDCTSEMADTRADLTARGVPETEWPKLTAPRLHRHWANTVNETWDEWRCPRNRTHRWAHEDYTRWIETRQSERGA